MNGIKKIQKRFCLFTLPQIINVNVIYEKIQSQSGSENRNQSGSWSLKGKVESLKYSIGLSSESAANHLNITKLSVRNKMYIRPPIISVKTWPKNSCFFILKLILLVKKILHLYLDILEDLTVEII